MRALEYAVNLVKNTIVLVALTAFNITEICNIFENKENYSSISIEDEIQNSKNLIKSFKEYPGAELLVSVLSLSISNQLLIL